MPAPPRLEVIIPDLHGMIRGLSTPLTDKDNFLTGQGLTWPHSLFTSRFDGGVSEGGARGIIHGDPDHPIHYVDGSWQPVPWQAGDEQAVFAMSLPDGQLDLLDPRHLLAHVVQKLQQDGITAQVACEFEFYLLDKNNDLVGNAPFSDLYSLEAPANERAFLSAVSEHCQQQAIPIGNIIAEYGSGQWEINLHHTDPLTACLQGILFRRLIRCTARAHQLNATFMAKPFAAQSGSGMHMHISLWQGDKNLLADPQKLQQAVAGALAICPESTLFCAPFANSYQRFLPNNYAPIANNWGHENRNTTIRVPRDDSDNATRFELRLPGADCNPYLIAASLLAGAHWGLCNDATPPPENTPHPQALPATWHAAIESFAQATILPQYLPLEFTHNYLHVKKDEWARQRVHRVDYERNFYSRII